MRLFITNLKNLNITSICLSQTIGISNQMISLSLSLSFSILCFNFFASSFFVLLFCSHSSQLKAILKMKRFEKISVTALPSPHLTSSPHCLVMKEVADGQDLIPLTILVLSHESARKSASQVELFLLGWFKL